ncbi:MAG: ABC transporter permease [Chitinophagales bacterium]|nr:ABC transporter permease [Chitinophagales bacterium]MDW8427040.1 ABC transporter permease [Chitinophagales bacterium]
MLAYVLHRLLWFLPTLIAITLIGFLIHTHAPGDALQRLAGGEEHEAWPWREQDRRLWAQRLGLNLPPFYLAVMPLAFPDTLHRIFDRRERSAAKYWLLRSGDAVAVERYRQLLKGALADAQPRPGISFEHHEQLRLARQQLRALLWSRSVSETDSLIKALQGLLQHDSLLFRQTEQILSARQQLEAGNKVWRAWVPVVRFYVHNQYHRWLFGDGNWLTGEGAMYSQGVVRGDFGLSYASRRPVGELVRDRIGWSLLFALLSTLIAYLISIPLGIQAALRQGKAFDHISSLLLFSLNAMPSFWVASLLILLLANPSVLAWFPASGVMPPAGYPPQANLWQRLMLTLPHLVLPLIAYTYGALAYLSRITRASLLEALQQDYIRTARAKGLPEQQVVYRHALRNSLLPLITVFAQVFPAAIGGSVVLETVFSIPGMGLEAARAVTTQDFPVVAAVFTLAGLFSLLGFLIADILYALADPRIKYRRR